MTKLVSNITVTSSDIIQVNNVLTNVQNGMFNRCYLGHVIGRDLSHVNRILSKLVSEPVTLLYVVIVVGVSVSGYPSN